MKNNFAISFITITLITVAAAEDCADKCVRKEKCLPFGKLTQEAQDLFQSKHPCSAVDENERSKVYGFDIVAKGDFVCCSNSLWGTTKESDPYSDYPNYDYPNSPNNGWAPYNRGYNNDNPYGSNQGNPNYGYVPNRPPKNYFHAHNNPYVTQSPFSPEHRPSINAKQGGQCPITSFPPAPATGCCGREASDSDRIIGHRPLRKPRTVPNYGWRPQPAYRRYPTPYNPLSWAALPNYGLGLNRARRSTDINIDVGGVQNYTTRIIGGHETKLTDFPWTVLLQITFDYGNRKAAFNCGGSLISSRYVLTAGHCVYDKGGKVVDLDVYLAEYDKRTFPRDCKREADGTEKCITNILMKAYEVTLHPQYDDTQLKNDIALIRLKDNAPYTDYIRPICLPSIDIDSPRFFNLRLAVAGWGRNGRFRSDIKQSTVVNLVPQDKCLKYYPGLTKESLCAAGYTGEDTCKGDSGGPLMTLYGGKYEVVGIVSGKRADSACGKPVPSLYTNVYHYLDWIKNNIKK